MIQDILLDMALILSRLTMPVENNHIEGTVSLNFDLGLSFYFMYKKREDLCDFFILIFLHFIKQKRGPISKI